MKHKFEKKQTISVCGTLELEDDVYVISVEDKDGRYTNYSLKDLLDEMIGQTISLSSDTNIA